MSWWQKISPMNIATDEFLTNIYQNVKIVEKHNKSWKGSNSKLKEPILRKALAPNLPNQPNPTTTTALTWNVISFE